MDFIDDLQKWLRENKPNHTIAESYDIFEDDYENDFNFDDDDIEENTTGNVAGYNTPFAFSKKGYRFKDKQYEKFIDTMLSISEKSQKSFAQEWKEYDNKPKKQFQFGVAQLKKELGDLERMVKLMDSFRADNDIQLQSLWKSSQNDMIKIETRLMNVMKLLNKIYTK